MRRSTWVAAVLLMLVSALCSACADPADADRSPSAIFTTDSGPRSATLVTIGFGAWETERARYEPLIASFNRAHPEIQVVFVSLDQATAVAAGASGSAPDMMRQIVGAADTAAVSFASRDHVERGYLADLQPLIAADASFDAADFYPGALSSLADGDGVYALPRSVSPPLLRYNSDLLAARGIAPPAQAWSWAELMAAAEQLADADAKTPTYGLALPDGGFSALAGELAASGMPMITTPADTAQLDTPAVAAALERVARWGATGAILPRAQTMPDQADTATLRQQVIDGHVGIWLDALVEPRALEHAAFTAGATPFPAVWLPFLQPVGESLIMSSGTAHPEAAWQWLAFLSRQTTGPSADGGGPIGHVAARRSLAAQSGAFTPLDDTARAALTYALEHPAVAPQGDVDVVVVSALQDALAATSAGRPAAQALADVQKQLRAQASQAATNRAPTPAPHAAPITVALPQRQQPVAGATSIVFQAPAFEVETFRQIAERFQRRRPDIAIDVRPSASTAAELQSSGLAGNSDCFASAASPKSLLGTTLDLSPLLDADPGFRDDDYPLALLQPFQQGGRRIGLPLAAAARVLMYDAAAFDQAGLLPPSPDWTLDDFVSAARKLTRSGADGTRYGFASPSGGIRELSFVLQQLHASPFVGGDPALPNFTDPAVAQALDAYRRLLEEASPHQHIQGYTATSWENTPAELIAQGRVAMWFADGVGQSFIAPGAGGQAGPQIRAAAIPLAQGLSQDDIIGSGLYIAAATEHPEACWAWLSYLSSEYMPEQGMFPARTSLADASLGRMRPEDAAIYRSYAPALQQGASADTALGPIYGDPRWYWLNRALDRSLGGSPLTRELADAQRYAEEFTACVADGLVGDCSIAIDPHYGH